VEIAEDLKNLATKLLEKSNKENKPDVEFLSLLLDGWCEELL